MNKRSKGKVFEEIAEKYLLRKNYKILFKNFFSRYGEIDIIALDRENNLVFIEVKGRNSLNYGRGEESITTKKIKSLIKTAQYFLYKYPDIEYNSIRFDVISIFEDKINHIENAFYME
ncbi:MAG: YraN family protein [Persephonella sp.]|nr:MAG: YraN family protein [Persephonella sp.]RUM61487.1 MAG: YraN family protein [Persephonella sp.]